ncbi:hypothetical protein Xcel_3244 [Xylanimonas cellulosilytica DSM 15894]|uniref:Uncharacterized protein n=1 Tax=Xylanimonas cellulosilytica (strain DSM 15894 / JCM 12276 / CECT 5975 / KCTC 9989 / LMG 20990 / NBRC 107835 / XIL07) TaxID=446471 RepID=D1C0P1_XYLCX|nr:hypothetical protein [Xylanimonas cellulosilytica]ACZ32244.1 hypothetical protein Xcel_3244 [Xylanimonas cellulosilytica DSM 15894]
MTHRPRTALTRLRTAWVTALLAALVLLTSAVPASAGPVSAEPAAVDRSPVVFVGVAGLQWSDVDADRTPTLWRLVGGGSVGSMAVRTLTPTCPRDAWLTISAGSRFVSPPVPADDLDSDACRGLPLPELLDGAPGDGVAGTAAFTDWEGVLRTDERGSYGTPGTLGAHLAAAGECTTAVGPGAALALADAGRIDRYSPTLADLDPAELTACPVTVIDAGALPDRGDARSDALRDLDATLRTVVNAVDDGTRVLVSGIADTPLGAPTLQVVVDWRAPGRTATWIDSRSSRWQGVAVLDDVAATLGGTGTGDGSELAQGEARRMTTSRTVDHRRYLTVLTDTIAQLTPVLVASLGGAIALTLLVVGLRRRRQDAPGAHSPRTGVPVLLVAAAAPAGATLATLSRWWVWPAPTSALAVTVAVGTLAVALAAWYARHLVARTPLPLAVAVAAVTWLVLTVDGLTGTTLQQGSLLGPSPALGARFFGFGNTVFAVYAVAALVLAWGLASLPRRANRALSILVCLAVVTIVVTVAPLFGADAGGLLALVPAFAVLLYRFAGWRASPLRAVLIVGAATAAIAVVVALLAWLLPGDGAHLGAFVQRLIDGEALAVVRSKAAGAWATVASVPGALAVVLCLATAWATLRPERFRWNTLVRAYREIPGLRTLVLALWTVAVVGSAVNDSGIVVALVVHLAAVPIIGVALLLRPSDGAAPTAPAAAPAAAPGGRASATAGLRVAGVAAGMIGVLLIGSVVAPAPGAPARAGDVIRGGTEVLTTDSPVVVVGTSGVRWSDVSPEQTPALWSLLRDGADAGGVTPAVVDVHRRCAGAGWLGLSAGRTVITGSAVPGGFDCLPWSVDAVPASADDAAASDDAAAIDNSAVVVGWGDLTAAQARSPFRPGLGTFGSALADAGVCATAVGPGAALALAERDGTTPRYVPFDDLTTDAFGCPLTVVDAGAAPTTEPDRDAALAAVDANVRRTLAMTPRNATVLVVDVGNPTPDPSVLGVGLVQGASTAPARFVSSTATRWEGVVRLLDLPLSLTAALDVPQPTEFSGSPLLLTGTRPPGVQTVDELELLSTRDRALRQVTGTTTAIPLWIALAALGALVLSPRIRATRGARRGIDGLFLVLASIPAGQFLMTAWSWWLPSTSPGRMWAALVASTLLVAAVAALAPRRPVWAAPTVIASITFGLLTLDAVLGTPLHRGSPLGPAVTLGGRFFGFGNPTYSVYVAAGLVAAAGLGTIVAARFGRRWAGLLVSVVGLVALVITLWPDFGADVGGGLVVLPAFAILALVVSGLRVTWKRLVAVAVIGVGLVAGIGVLDWLRPAAERTHLGIFVQSVIDGSALETVWRKAGFALRTVTRGPEAWITLAVLVAFVLVLLGVLRARWLDRARTDWPVLVPLLVALLVAAVGGAFVNDYGVRIVTIMMFTAVPLVGLLVTRGSEDARSAAD